MSTAVATHPSVVSPEHIVLHDVTWALYQKLLEDVGERPIHITFDNGSLEIMTLSSEHEGWKTIIGGMIELLALELNIAMCRRGSTTFMREDLAKGLEPDECYYIQNAAAVRGKKRLSLSEDPPPDLVVEVDVSYQALDREGIYAAMGVKELWRFDDPRLIGLKLSAEGQYQAIEMSLAFPFLRITDLEPFLRRTQTEDETSVMRAFRDWVRTNLLK